MKPIVIEVRRIIATRWRAEAAKLDVAIVKDLRELGYDE